jgi:hypothetical protein
VRFESGVTVPVQRARLQPRDPMLHGGDRPLQSERRISWRQEEGTALEKRGAMAQDVARSPGRGVLTLIHLISIPVTKHLI